MIDLSNLHVGMRASSPQKHTPPANCSRARLSLTMDRLRLLCFSSALCLWLLLGTAKCEGSRRPVLHKPPGSPGTGCYFIVLKDKTSDDEMQQLMASICKLADDFKIHAVMKKISKAFTVRLSPYALEMVLEVELYKCACIIQNLCNHRFGECQV